MHSPRNLSYPPVSIPKEYAEREEEGTEISGYWWEAFQSPTLNTLMDQAMNHNFGVRQSLWKVAQVCAEARIQATGRYPEILSTFSTSHLHSSAGSSTFGGTGNISSSAVSSGSDSFTFYRLSNTLSYEVDLWGRVDATAKAACRELAATREDLEATLLLLSRTIADLWFVINEQKTLLQVIDHQIKVSRTQLELIELRFSVGESSALDVYQQRLQLAQTEEARPSVLSRLETAYHQLDLLLGLVPIKHDLNEKIETFSLPPFPNIGVPIKLLSNRPDLRATFHRLHAADEEVAAAIANLFPRLDLSIAYNFETQKIKNLFDDAISRITGDLIAPIFDGGRRRAEVTKRKAIVCERLYQYAETFLKALVEVEDALVEEQRQQELLAQLKKEKTLAEANLEESQWHYINGRNDYLTVIAAIQTVQNLERRLVAEKSRLLQFRTKLYSAIGSRHYTDSEIYGRTPQPTKVSHDQNT